MNDCAREYVYSLTLRIWEGHEAVATIAQVRVATETYGEGRGRVIRHGCEPLTKAGASPEQRTATISFRCAN